ncbi:MAG: TonB-dependent receptor [Solimonas sp.]
MAQETAADAQSESSAGDTANGSVAEIVVTSTRRASSVQDTPINITAVGGTQIDDLGIKNIDDVAKLVPGLTLVDDGPWSNHSIIVRGLNADNITGNGGGMDGGGTVATYLGETPLYVDFKLLDIDRVEAMMGPQGTLYGAGTLAGAVRYIPNKPDLEKYSADFHGRLYSLKEGNGLGHQEDATINVPLIPGTLAVRGVFGQYNDPGFIDYPRIVRYPGISDPDPDLSDADAVAANLKRETDLNYEDTFTTRITTRYVPVEWFEANLTYAYQDTKTGGRQIQNVDAAGTGKYEAGYRWAEPSNRAANLVSLELNADFGFADLVSSTSYADQRNRTMRDQTDLLLDLSYTGDYGYESFPEFIAYTTGDQQKRQLTQEIRLVSKDTGALTWIGGAFYNHVMTDYLGIEYTPGLAAYLGDVRADDMEYWEKDHSTTEEKALFGEIGYKLTPAWQVTVGGRFYDYSDEQVYAVDLPLLNSDAYALSPTGGSNSGGSHGFLYKVNTSYQFTKELLTYATVSEGYRLGGINDVAACPDDLDDGSQHVCALPDEQTYKPDKTTNYELGVHSQWFEHRLMFNADVFYVDWTDVQIGTTTTYGAVGITGNGGKASSAGYELSFQAKLPAHLTLSGNYAYTHAKLTQTVPDLLSDHYDSDVDAEKGDRLPGTPKESGSLFLGYAVPLSGEYMFKANYGVTFKSSVLTKPGARAYGEALGGYAIHQANFGVAADRWEVSLYGENIFNKYAITSVTQDKSYIYDNDLGSETFDVRRYGRYVNRPASFGVDFRIHF